MVKSENESYSRQYSTPNGWMKRLVINYLAGIMVREVGEEGKVVLIVRVSREGHRVERR